MKRRARNADEHDCFYARKYMKRFERAGVSTAIKRRARKRERREAKRKIEEQD